MNLAIKNVFVGFFEFQQDDLCTVLQDRFAIATLDPCSADVGVTSFHRDDAAHLPLVAANGLVDYDDEVADAQVPFSRPPF